METLSTAEQILDHAGLALDALACGEPRVAAAQLGTVKALARELAEEEETLDPVRLLLDALEVSTLRELRALVACGRLRYQPATADPVKPLELVPRPPA